MAGTSFEFDNQLGDIVRFDGEDVYAIYSADLIEMKPLAGTISANYAYNTGLTKYKLYRHDVPLRTLELRFYVRGGSHTETETNVSGLLSAAKECVITTSKSDFEYAAILTGYTDTDTGVDFYHLVVLKFAAVKRLPLQTIEYDNSSSGSSRSISISAKGIVATGARVEITPSRAKSTTTITGFFSATIAFGRIAAGQTLIIDGIDGSVTCNGENMLEIVTNMWDFPKLQPGRTTITIPSYCKVSISYYPLYV